MDMVAAACGLPTISGSSRCAECLVRHRAFCAALDRDEIGALEEIVDEVSLATNHSIFLQDDAADTIYSVFAGTVKTYKLLPDGRCQVLGFLTAGDLLGFASTDEYAYNAETLTPARLCRIPRPKLRALADRFPALEGKLLQITAAELAESQAQVLALGRKTAQERIAAFLIRLVDRSRDAGGDGDPLPLTMSRHDIADYMGLTAETVSRVLTRFARDGLISMPHPYEVGLLQEDRLRRLADGD